MNIDFVSRQITVGAPSTQWWTQLSTAIAFGLAFATVLTLVVTPSALMLRANMRDRMDRWSERRAARRTAKAAAVKTPPPSGGCGVAVHAIGSSSCSTSAPGGGVPPGSVKMATVMRAPVVIQQSTPKITAIHGNQCGNMQASTKAATVSTPSIKAAEEKYRFLAVAVGVEMVFFRQGGVGQEAGLGTHEGEQQPGRGQRIGLRFSQRETQNNRAKEDEIADHVEKTAQIGDAVAPRHGPVQRVQNPVAAISASASI